MPPVAPTRCPLQSSMAWTIEYADRNSSSHEEALVAHRGALLAALPQHLAALPEGALARLCRALDNETLYVLAREVVACGGGRPKVQPRTL